MPRYEYLCAILGQCPSVEMLLYLRLALAVLRGVLIGVLGLKLWQRQQGGICE